MRQAWAIDNNLQVALLDATWLASVTGIAAGGTNLAIALLVGAEWPSVADTFAALVIGALTYGPSLVLFVVGLRHLGAARTTACFSVAPFVGAIVAILWLHDTRHAHRHQHVRLRHAHAHFPDAHHRRLVREVPDVR
jgi:drug/metabolite transporter (DMT)-like permease